MQALSGLFWVGGGEGPRYTTLASNAHQNSTECFKLCRFFKLHFELAARLVFHSGANLSLRPWKKKEREKAAIALDAGAGGLPDERGRLEESGALSGDVERGNKQG